MLGIEKKIPDASDVKMAFISANYAVGGSDSESVEQVREIHRQIVDSKKEFEEYADHNDGESYFVMVCVKGRLHPGAFVSDPVKRGDAFG